MRPISIAQNEFSFDFSQSPNVRWGRSSELGKEDSVSHSMEYYVNDGKIAERFGHILDSQLADWIDIALACYLADRLAVRLTGRGTEAGVQWARVFNLVVPVRERVRWSNVEVKARLEQLLHFFTDDVWHFEFVERVGPRRPAESQGFLFSFDSNVPVRVALYSGGLDSFAGAAQTIREFSDSAFVFVSGVTNGRQQSAQRKQLDILRKWSNREIWQVGVPYGLLWSASGSPHKEESSQRTRGFLFLTIGAVSAIAAGSSTLFLYENGIGAINLPYDGTQVGAYNSRATHPVALLRMQDFIERLIDNSFSIENPFAFSTKAEMCRHGAVQELRDHLDLTFSCDGFPVRAKDKAQCGLCTSCLLRRQSIESAGLSAFDRKGYLHDLTRTGVSFSEKQLHSLLAMDWQAQRIKAALAQANPWEALIQEFVELRKLESELCRSGRVERHVLRDKLIRLYSQYAAEWESFATRRLCDRGRRIA
jgi:7-cyano-7-deazaguanine synthase in queuosine biosynthesis